MLSQISRLYSFLGRIVFYNVNFHFWFWFPTFRHYIHKIIVKTDVMNFFSYLFWEFYSCRSLNLSINYILNWFLNRLLDKDPVFFFFFSCNYLVFISISSEDHIFSSIAVLVLLLKISSLYMFGFISWMFFHGPILLSLCQHHTLNYCSFEIMNVMTLASFSFMLANARNFYCSIWNTGFLKIVL